MDDLFQSLVATGQGTHTHARPQADAPSQQGAAFGAAFDALVTSDTSQGTSDGDSQRPAADEGAGEVETLLTLQSDIADTVNTAQVLVDDVPVPEPATPANIAINAQFSDADARPGPGGTPSGSVEPLILPVAPDVLGQAVGDQANQPDEIRDDTAPVLVGRPTGETPLVLPPAPTTEGGDFRATSRLMTSTGDADPTPQVLPVAPDVLAKRADETMRSALRPTRNGDGQPQPQTIPASVRETAPPQPQTIPTSVRETAPPQPQTIPTSVKDTAPLQPQVIPPSTASGNRPMPVAPETQPTTLLKAPSARVDGTVARVDNPVEVPVAISTRGEPTVRGLQTPPVPVPNQVPIASTVSTAIPPQSVEPTADDASDNRTTGPVRTGGWTIPAPNAPAPYVLPPMQASFPVLSPAMTTGASSDLSVDAMPDLDFGLQAGFSPIATTALTPSTSLLAHAPSATAQVIAQQIATAWSSASLDAGTPLELALDPPELGRVRMQMAEIAGVMTLSILAERPETADLMRRNLDLLAQEFTQAGLDAPSVHISQEGSDQSDGNGHDDTQVPENALAAESETDALPIIPTRTATGGLDLRL